MQHNLIQFLSDGQLRRDFLVADVTGLRRLALAVAIPPSGTEPLLTEEQVLEEGGFVCHEVNCDGTVCG